MSNETFVAAARDAFTADGTSASLEDIARRANVAIGTLYRHFPARQDLLVAVYVEEVEAMARSAEGLAELPPWDALAGWLRRFVGYAATKRVIAEELLTYLGEDSDVLQRCRTAITETGDSLLRRAQDAGAARPDATFADVGRMVAGIAAIRNSDPEQIDRILELALDGLRYRPSN